MMPPPIERGRPGGFVYERYDQVVRIAAELVLPLLLRMTG